MHDKEYICTRHMHPPRTPRPLPYLGLSPKKTPLFWRLPLNGGHNMWTAFTRRWPFSVFWPSLEPTFGLMVAVLNWPTCSLGGGNTLSSSTSLLLFLSSISSSSSVLLSPSTDVLSDVDDSVSLGSKESLFTEPLGDDPLFLKQC